LGVGQGANNPLKQKMSKFQSVKQGLELRDSLQCSNEPSSSTNIGKFIDHRREY
jgi:hypothetical protein